MTLDLRVRRATGADVSAIRRVLAVTWRDTYGAFLPLEEIEPVIAVWHAPSALVAELGRATTFSGIVGMVTAHDRHEAVEIARLYVLPSAQRRGLGRQLLAAALAQNPTGRAFYLKEGFVETGERTVDAFGTHLRTIAMQRLDGGGARAEVPPASRS